MSCKEHANKDVLDAVETTCDVPAELKRLRDQRFAAAMGFCHRGSLQGFLIFTSERSAGRKPVLHADDMEVILRSGKVAFTNGSDVDKVIGKYRSFFFRVADKATVLNFEAPMQGEAGGGLATYSKAMTVRWSLEEMGAFSKSLVHFRRCRKLMHGSRPHQRHRADLGRCSGRHACFARSRLPLVEKPLDQQL